MAPLLAALEAAAPPAAAGALGAAISDAAGGNAAAPHKEGYEDGWPSETAVVGALDCNSAERTEQSASGSDVATAASALTACDRGKSAAAMAPGPLPPLLLPPTLLPLSSAAGATGKPAADPTAATAPQDRCHTHGEEPQRSSSLRRSPAATSIASTAVSTGSAAARPFQVSVHEVPPGGLLQAHLAAMFPEAPFAGTLLAVPTFQPLSWQPPVALGPTAFAGHASDGAGTDGTGNGTGCSGGAGSAARHDGSGNSSSGSAGGADASPYGGRHGDILAAMDSCYVAFDAWCRHVAGALRRAGYWCDAVNPKTGYPLYSPARMEQYNEVRDKLTPCLN